MYKNKKILRITALLLLTALITSCSTMTRGSRQVIEVDAPGCKEKIVKCELTNKKGTWIVYPPWSVQIKKSDDILKIKCTTEQGDEVKLQAPSLKEGHMWTTWFFMGFWLFGIPLITDAITDAHRTYPNKVIVPICSYDKGLKYPKRQWFD